MGSQEARELVLPRLSWESWPTSPSSNSQDTRREEAGSYVKVLQSSSFPELSLRLETGDFTTLTRTVTPNEFKLPQDGISLDEVERQLLVQALERAGGNQTQAGQLLGINRDQVRYRIEKFGLAVKS